MTQRADIYLISGSTFSEVKDFCLRLCSKVWEQQLPALILTATEHGSELLHQTLWQQESNSFIPSRLVSSAQEPAPAAPEIWISHSAAPSNLDSSRYLLVLINRQPEDAIETFHRVALVVPNQDTEIAKARQSYRAFKAKLPEVHIHDMRRG